MRKLSSFTHVTLDGFFADNNSDMSWAHQGNDNAEWSAFVAGNAQGGGALVFGRVTYDMMAGYWPSSAARQANRIVAERMNALPKIVFSRTLAKASWSNTTLVKGELLGAVKKLKAEAGPDMAILGSGSIVAQLAGAGLIDDLQLVVNPLALGKGKALFAGVKKPVSLKLTKSRTFGNGKVVLWYAPA
ncbi:MAG TPA: dihydrofolate reductase family protein [Rhizomicrobium sp.]